jgi:hypothetical protein
VQRTPARATDDVAAVVRERLYPVWRSVKVSSGALVSSRNSDWDRCASAANWVP